MVFGLIGIPFTCVTEMRVWKPCRGPGNSPRSPSTLDPVPSHDIVTQCRGLQGGQTDAPGTPPSCSASPCENREDVVIWSCI